MKAFIGASSAAAMLATAAVVSPARAQPQISPSLSARQCTALADYATSLQTESALKRRLAQLPEAPTSIMEAKVVPAYAKVPEVCQVEGLVAPDIHFELRMPTTRWNGKFMHYGCGGACGIVYRPQLEEPLERGYAVVASDMGHQGAPNNWAFAYADLQALIDFSYRATHVVTQASKVVVKAYYGTPARFSYFDGCSTGGVQGVIEAQRYPHDFDGIIAGAPAYSSGPGFIDWNQRADIGADGRLIMDPDKLPMLRKAVLADCDGLDGHVDGIIQDPRVCHFDPAKIQCRGPETKTCLTAAEVGVVRKLYSGPTDSTGKSLAYGPGGLSRGSEYNWPPYYVGKKGDVSSYVLERASSYGNGIYPLTPSEAARPYDYDLDPKADSTGISLNGPTLQWLRYASNPDLRGFRDAGGKLLLWHGWDDNEVAPGSSVDYYQTTSQTMGGEAATQSFFRLFMLPATGHCRRGPGGDSVDWISALENWVEKGQAPDQVIAYHLKTEQNYLGLPRPRYPLPPESYDRTRPVYPFPLIAHYKGSGDDHDAANWTSAKAPG